MFVVLPHMNSINCKKEANGPRRIVRKFWRPLAQKTSDYKAAVERYVDVFNPILKLNSDEERVELCVVRLAEVGYPTTSKILKLCI